MKIYTFRVNYNRLLLGLTLVLLVFMLGNDMSQAFSDGKYFIASLDTAMALGVIHQWWTVWCKQIN